MLPVNLSGERKQGQMPGPFYGHGQSPLVPGAIPRDTPRYDLASIGNELAQQPLVLVVDLIHLILAETTGFSFPSLELNHSGFALQSF
jgi:ribosomal protein L25 (general stress protein Ctc)